MSHFKTVFDFIQSVPAALRHEEIYLSKVGNMVGLEPDVVLSVWEESTLGLGERNILRDLNIPEKFICSGMDVNCPIISSSLAKQKDKTSGLGSLKNSKQYDESFKLKRGLELSAQSGVIHNSGRPGLQVPDNEPLYRQLASSLSGVSCQSLAGPALSFIGEKMVARQDLRHFFLKGYLMLMSFNLAVTAGVKKYKYRNISYDLQTSATDEKKMCVLMAYDVVVDVDHFTKEELWLMAEMAGSYPNRRYGDMNIYNGISLGEDLMTFMTKDKEFGLGENPGYGSPERMWYDIVSIAIKMDALEDLREVVRDFRGVPGILRHINELTGREVFELLYPKSYSVGSCIESLCSRHPYIRKNSGYYATSKCLVADLLLSGMLQMSAFNVIEEFGGLGKTCIPTGDPMTDSFYNSHLRNLGLKSAHERDNMLLMEWRGIRGCSMQVGFGGKLKDYVQRMTSKVRRKERSFLRPQLLYALPFTTCKNTAWAVVRNWKFQDFEFRAELEDRVLSNQMVKAFTWVMGVSDDLPMVGMNALGERYLSSLSSEELKYIVLASGEYEIGLVRHMIGAELRPRLDEFEMEMNAFYSTNFPGTRCTIVFDDGGMPRMVEEGKLEYQLTTATIGRLSSGEREDLKRGYYTVGGSYKAHVERKSSNNEGMSGKGVIPPRPTFGRFADKRDGQGKTPVENKGSGMLGNDAGGESKKGEGGAGNSDDINNGSRGEKTDTPGGKKEEEGKGNNDDVNKNMKTGADEVKNGNGINNDKLEIDVNKLTDWEKRMLGVPVDGDKKSVVGRPVGKIPLRLNKIIHIVDGKKQGVAVELHNGERVTIDVPDGGSVSNYSNVKGYRLFTPGDGTCGVHAVLQDMLVKGYVDDKSSIDTYMNLMSHGESSSWHDVSELAGMCNVFGMGMTLINLDSKSVSEYGVKDAIDNVHIVYEQGHFTTFIPNDNGPTHYEGLSVDKSELPPWETYRGIVAARSIFRESGLVSMAMRDAFRKVVKPVDTGKGRQDGGGAKGDKGNGGGKNGGNNPNGNNGRPGGSNWPQKGPSGDGGGGDKGNGGDDKDGGNNNFGDKSGGRGPPGWKKF